MALVPVLPGTGRSVCIVIPGKRPVALPAFSPARQSWSVIGLIALAGSAMRAEGMAQGLPWLRLDQLGLCMLLPLALAGLCAATPRDHAGCTLSVIALMAATPLVFTLAAATALAVSTMPATDGPRRKPATLPVLLMMAAALFQAPVISICAALACCWSAGLARFAGPSVAALSNAPGISGRATAPGHSRGGQGSPVAGGVTACLLGLALVSHTLLGWSSLAPPPGIDAGWGYLLASAAMMLALLLSLRALSRPTLMAGLSAVFAASAALAASAIGLAVISRAGDLSLSGLAAGRVIAFWLCGLAPAGIAMLMVGQGIAAAAGSDRLSHLGGLAGLMPRRALLFALSLISLSGLPPACGFALFWQEAELLLAQMTGVTPAAALPFRLLLAGLGIVSALMTLAALRLGVIVLLGGARAPRAAASADVKWHQAAPAIAGLAIAGFVSILPGLWQAVTGGSAVQLAGQAPLAGVARVSLATLLDFSAPDGLSTHSPMLVLVLIAVMVAVVALIHRRFAALAVVDVVVMDAPVDPPHAAEAMTEPAVGVAGHSSNGHGVAGASSTRSGSDGVVPVGQTQAAPLLLGHGGIAGADPVTAAIGAMPGLEGGDTSRAHASRSETTGAHPRAAQSRGVTPPSRRLWIEGTSPQPPWQPAGEPLSWPGMASGHAALHAALGTDGRTRRATRQAIRFLLRYRRKGAAAIEAAISGIHAAGPTALLLLLGTGFAVIAMLAP